jgi:hypothetical protein
MTLLAIGFGFILGLLFGAVLMGITLMHDIKSKGETQ